jgi:predicted site-specific integrase-resolvase
MAKSKQQRRGDADAYSIDEFCERNGISRAFFTTLRSRGLAPRVMKVGGRVLISKEAAAEWRRDREND